jgi:hypothetical protein
MLPPTPGLRYIAKEALSCTVPVIWGVALQQLLNRALDVNIPTWIIICGSPVALPVGAVIRLLLKEWRDRQNAAAMGAQIVPKVKGKSFGNLDVVKKSKEAWMSGYIGACNLMSHVPINNSVSFMLLGEELDEYFDLHGSMYNLNPMYSDLFFTMSPEHMKAMLTTDFTNFIKGAVLRQVYRRTSALIFYVGERLQEAFGSVLGSGVLNSDGTRVHPPFFLFSNYQHSSGDMWKYVVFPYPIGLS